MPKVKRNLELAEQFRNKRCHVCQFITGGSGGSVCGHHIISFKSNPKLDIEENLIALCQKHHNEFHSKPLSEVVTRYGLDSFLIERGFYKCELTGKWRYDFGLA